MVRVGGLEPPAPPLRTAVSSQLTYTLMERGWTTRRDSNPHLRHGKAACYPLTPRVVVMREMMWLRQLRSRAPCGWNELQRAFATERTRTSLTARRRGIRLLRLAMQAARGMRVVRMAVGRVHHGRST